MINLTRHTIQYFITFRETISLAKGVSLVFLYLKVKELCDNVGRFAFSVCLSSKGTLFIFYRG